MLFDIDNCGELSFHVWLDNGYKQLNFGYETYEDMWKDWNEGQIIESLKREEILEDFKGSLEYHKGFYYSSNMSEISWNWVEIDITQLEVVKC